MAAREASNRGQLPDRLRMLEPRAPYPVEFSALFGDFAAEADRQH